MPCRRREHGQRRLRHGVSGTLSGAEQLEGEVWP